MQIFAVPVDFNLLSFNSVMLPNLTKSQQIQLLELMGFTCCEILESFLYKAGLNII